MGLSEVQPGFNDESISKCQLSSVSPTFKPTVTSSASGLSAPEEIRTPNLLIRSQMLYPLSYGRMCSVI
jgi:hypothetical protein